MKRVFIGLENINPANLLGAKKQQNKITEYRRMLLAWKRARILTYCGYILGFPNDTPESILHDIRVIQKELPVDLLEFFYLTPLPGSEDHRKLHDAGVPMDTDLNKYDLNHAVTRHSRMSREQWEETYALAWKTYYTKEHITTILKRAMATGTSPGKAVLFITWFTGCIGIEGIHPLEGGFLRLKFRRDRRPGLPLEPLGLFYPNYLTKTAVKQLKWIQLYLGIYSIYKRIKRDPRRFEYTDVALSEVSDDETDTMEMFQSEVARIFVQKIRRSTERNRQPSNNPTENAQNAVPA